MFVYLLPRALSLFCTHPAYSRVKRLLKGVCFLFKCSLNLKTFRPPHLQEGLELMTLPKTAVLVAKYYPTLIWVTAVLFQGKQRALGKTLKKYIFARAAWTDSSEDLMINALIWNFLRYQDNLLMSALLNLIGETFGNLGQIPQKLSS